MSWFSSLFGGGKTVQPQSIDTRNPQKEAMDQFLANFVNTYGSQYKPGQSYTGAFTAGMSPGESSAMDLVKNYMTQGAPQGITDSSNFLSGLINGQFNPATSPQYQAFRNTAGYNQQNAIRDLNANLGSRGKYFSTEGVNKTGDITAQTSNSLNQTLADLVNQYQGRQLNAIPQQSAIQQFLFNMPLNQATAGTTIGALPRQLNQQDLEARYQDFMRQQSELKGVVGDATGVSSTPVTQGYPLPNLQQNTGQQTGQMIGQIIPFISSLLPMLGI